MPAPTCITRAMQRPPRLAHEAGYEAIMSSEMAGAVSASQKPPSDSLRPVTA
jgi:hypothetical protein